MWFNEVAKAPLPAFKKNWFRSATFRRAISQAINRDDLSRVVFRGHAQPAIGPVSPANKFWFNAKLKPEAYSPDAALKALQGDGFRLENGTLKDKEGNAVVFSIITNSGNKYRERMATMIQEDLQKIGIHVNVVTLDFPSLIERMTQTFDYEAILLGLTNVGLDPNEQMNVWLSSSENHQWNPSEKTPETAWEAEIDNLMRAQASAADAKKRKGSFRSRAGNCGRAGAVHLSGEPKCSVGGRRNSAGSQPGDSRAADLLERGTAFGEVGEIRNFKYRVHSQRHD